MNRSVSVFFDIGNTLGSPKISSPSFRLEKIDIYPYIPKILQQLKNNGLKIGVISNTGNETEDDMTRVLKEAGIYSFFEPNLLIYSSVVGVSKPSPEIFLLAAIKADFANIPENCLYVGEDSKERKAANDLGWQVVSHPCLVWDVLNGSRLRYIRVTVPAEQNDQAWRSVIRELSSVVPLYVTGENGSQVYAIATTSSIPTLINLGFQVDFLGSENDPLTTELYLLRDDRQIRTGFLNPQGQSSNFFAGDEESQWVLSATSEGLYVALPSNHSVEEYHFEEAYHGHNLKLLPDPSLLEPFGEGNNARTAGFLQASNVERALSDFELEKLKTITADSIREYLERYAGITPIDESTGIKIKSRHIHSADIGLVTEALVKDFEKIGGGSFSIKIDRFVHEGRGLDNVEAELCGSESEEIVLVTAHLDSTAAFSDYSYNPERDPAPGADDDASGVAAVLVIADVIKQLAVIRPPKRTIRFVLFNAEEHGLVGSKAYARTQAALAAPIIGVYQMDMIGYNVVPPRSFEVHVGYVPSADVQARSIALAERIKRLIPEVSSNLELPQIYILTDPAAGRSDHASFHERGYAACVTSEDFFIGPEPGSPVAEANPNYHKDKDTFVDFDYAADIARVIAASAWLTANS
ncbi:M28 family peptidase [Crenothrix polyspora]|uniref:Peptidase M28 n=1 Tax=Crenothrix polyspora TaxID=360316 RepID=A0A1R4GZH4_9GAMM|nr:M28 family peptidase [Crenothrix polyspora]SJM89371.1 Peptidase M28 [Crenothrix polyspora]